AGRIHEYPIILVTRACRAVARLAEEWRASPRACPPELAWAKNGERVRGLARRSSPGRRMASESAGLPAGARLDEEWRASPRACPPELAWTKNGERRRAPPGSERPGLQPRRRK